MFVLDVGVKSRIAHVGLPARAAIGPLSFLELREVIVVKVFHFISKSYINRSNLLPLLTLALLSLIYNLPQSLSMKTSYFSEKIVQ